ncbi:MAG TPA: ATP-binding protein, partial [Burkholderiaceae bacterium]|nr:ATP-binding protein [Burkholderiaceae bacterium]
DYAIYMLDPEGFVASWNLGAQRIKGYDASDVIGRHFSNFFTPEDVEAGKPWEELASARSGGRAEAEGWRVRKDGSRFWARAVVTALHDATGRLRGFSKVTQDLSQRRQIQELEQAAERVQEFIAMLAHEIRNPLAPIHNAIHVMARTKLEDPAQLRMLEIIGRQAAQLGRIADDMLDISRVTQGKMVIQRVPVDIAEVVERAIDVAAPLIEAARHRLQVEMAAERRRVIGDQDRLVQVFSNLLNNSARYTPPGGSIAISVATEAEDVVVRVTDNGRGIDPSRLKSIFQMFVQEREPISRVGEGLGVGLALARSIVELHGGAIEARSDGAGKGSEFVVRLPRAAPHEATEPSAATKQHAPRAAAARSRRVLVVDDNADAAATLDMLLKALGHEARIARDGAEALAAFEAFRPDIVLLDIGLPGISGYEVARRLRRRGSTARIIAVTGWGQPKDREESAQAGIDLHLVKPIDAEQLQRVLAPERGGCNGTLH